MKIRIIAVGKRMPSWVEQACEYYLKQLPNDYQTEIYSISLNKRGKNCDVERFMRQEGEQIQAACLKNSQTIALERTGKQYSTEKFAEQLKNWHENSFNVNFLIGGPEGLAKQCLQQANQHWSIGHLTLPHPLVRVILAEQLYRSWSIIQKHPYHR